MFKTLKLWSLLTAQHHNAKPLSIHNRSPGKIIQAPILVYLIAIMSEYICQINFLSFMCDYNE